MSRQLWPRSPASMTPSRSRLTTAPTRRPSSPTSATSSRVCPSPGLILPWMKLVTAFWRPLIPFLRRIMSRSKLVPLLRRSHHLATSMRLLMTMSKRKFYCLSHNRSLLKSSFLGLAQELMNSTMFRPMLWMLKYLQFVSKPKIYTLYT